MSENLTYQFQFEHSSTCPQYILLHHSRLAEKED